MPINNTEEAKSRRPPGQLPSITRRVADAEAAMRQLPVSLKTALSPVLSPLLDMARQQDRFNLDQWLRFDALPGKHATTHLDGGDTVVGHDIPTAIKLTNVGDPGDPHDGLAPIGHVHPVGDDLEGLLPITEIVPDPLAGLPVSDPTLRRLLEEILLTVQDLEEALMSCVSPQQVVISQEPYNVASDTAESVLFGENARRAGFVMHNDSTQVLYVKFGAGASSTSYTYEVQNAAHLESLVPYTGVITGVWAAANGSARCTDMVFQNR